MKYKQFICVWAPCFIRGEEIRIDDQRIGKEAVLELQSASRVKASSIGSKEDDLGMLKNGPSVVALRGICHS
jgi:hypothetical protein